MGGQSDKDKRKEILRQLKAKEKETFYNALPMSKETFQKLFDRLDEGLENGCDHKMTLTIEFLESKGIPNIEQVGAWLNDHGGYCDCEVLGNVEEQFN